MTLALHGGKPTRSQLLPYGRHQLTEADLTAVVAVLRSDWLTGGPAVAAFERAFADVVGARHAVAFSSGTAALHGAMLAAGIGPGTEAITTPITFCATANAVLHAGGRPVFADVDPDTLSLSADAVAARIQARTRALVPVDYAGHPARLERLLPLAERHGLVVIEDAAHALGAQHAGRPVGSVAHLTTFSFHPVKHIACGEGGMVTTADDELARRLRRVRNHGLDSEARDRQGGARWAYDQVELGYNYRLTDLAAALGHAQLPRLAANLERRRAIAARYRAAFAALPEVMVLPEPPAGDASAWHLYPVRFATEQLGVDRGEILAALRAEGIGVNVHYQPVPALSHYRRLGYAPQDTPEAVAQAERLITLPMFHGMCDADADDVVAAVTKVVTWYRQRSGTAG